MVDLILFTQSMKSIVNIYNPLVSIDLASYGFEILGGCQLYCGDNINFGLLFRKVHRYSLIM